MGFEQIKSTIMSNIFLKNPNFSKDFILHAYGVEKRIAAILMQKKDNHDEHHIDFFNQTLHEAK